jgi:hypothetical protein
VHVAAQSKSAPFNLTTTQGEVITTHVNLVDFKLYEIEFRYGTPTYQFNCSNVGKVSGTDTVGFLFCLCREPPFRLL